jgi:hypothetical protein
MKKYSFQTWLWALSLAVCGATQIAVAFPPAPPAVVYGLVRDELGNPLGAGTGSVVFDSGTGVTNATTVAGQSASDGNYSLSIAMDSGVTSDTYKPTALMPAAPFRLKVVLGKQVLLPVEMQGNFGALGQPGSKTRIDLSLGVSSNNDGLPDAWKRAISQQLGLGLSPGQIHPGDVVPGTGLTFYQIYIAGTYYVAPTNGFALKMQGHDDVVSKFTFTGVKGHTYTVQAGSSLEHLAQVGFQVTSGNGNGPVVTTLVATNTSVINIQVPNSAFTDPATGFFRLTAE